MSTTTKPRHIGRNISRIRELRGMKQEVLAIALGVSQQTVSKIEQSESVEDSVLQKIAAALEVSAEGIANFSDEAVLNNIQNNYEGSIVHDGPKINYNCTFNPLDKVIELFEEKEKLYERLLQSEKDKIEYLEKLLKK